MGSEDTDKTREQTADCQPAVAPQAGFRSGERVGRYIVQKSIGSGAMGRVYAALDPELNRKVALKLLHTDGSGSASTSRRARLAREAQAQARLSHPNVVTVLDVGTVGQQVFVAMELIDGITLREWCAQPRGWRQVLRTLIAAGRGLAAAHHAQLIHRDFKPDNVMVGRDGRVCVTDFGLARAIDSLESSGAPTPGQPDSLDDDPLAARLTRTGALIGTPRYMAPEQHRREPTDPRTDQFSFCVTLYEALYGEPPFDAETIAAQARAVQHNDVRDPPATTDVPAWVRRVVLRGLEADPRDRYPNMDALLDELEHDPTEQRRWLGAVPALVAVAAGSVLVFSMVSGSERERCRGAESRWSGVWDDDTRQAVERSFKATRRPYARVAWSFVSRELDAYTRAWSIMYTQTCRARINKEQTPETLDRRDACLGRRRRDVRALARVFAAADSQVVERASEAVLALPDVDDCADPEALQRIAVPSTSATDPAVVAVRDQIASAEANLRAGKYGEALRVAKAAHAAAARTSDRALRAEAGLVLGELHSRNGDARTAETTVQEAVNDGIAGRQDIIVARGLGYLVYLVGAQLSRFDDATRLARRADAAIQRVGNPKDIRATFEAHLGFLYRAKGDYDTAKKHFTRSLDLRIEVHGPEHVAVARAYNNLGGAYLHLDTYKEAAQNHKRALTIYEKLLGPEHPEVASVLTNLGSVAHSQTEHKQAQQYHERALAIRQRALPADHPSVARSLDYLGLALYRQRQFDRAIGLYERALAIRKKAHGEHHPDVALSHHHLADASMQKRKYDQAIAHYQSAIATYERSVGKIHPKLAKVLVNLGIAHKNQGKYDEALKLYERARGIFAKTLNPKHPKIAAVHSNAAIVHTMQGNHDAAIAATHKALELYENGLGKEHWRTGMTYYNLGVAYNKAEKPAQALIYHRKGLAVRQNKGGKDHPAAASSLDEIGIAYWRQGKHAKALEALRQSLEIRTKKFKPGNVRFGLSQFYIGFVERSRRRHAAAIAAYQEAVAIFGKTMKPDDPYLAAALTGLGGSLLDAGRAADALPHLTRAVAIRDAGKGTPGESAESWFALGRALWKLGRDKPKAVELVQKARAGFEASIAKREEVTMYRRYLARAQAWLAKRG